MAFQRPPHGIPDYTTTLVANHSTKEQCANNCQFNVLSQGFRTCAPWLMPLKPPRNIRGIGVLCAGIMDMSASDAIHVCHSLKGRPAAPLLNWQISSQSPVGRDTLALVLAGGRGERLLPLTISCCKPAIPIAGQYRLIDFTLSNCLNSGIQQIGVLTQFRAQHLIRHLQNNWQRFRRERNEFLEILPAQQQMGNRWYAGTADAVYQNLNLLSTSTAKHVLILGGDHLYKADYSRLIDFHQINHADITVGCVRVPHTEVHKFGILDTHADHRVRSFIEKPDPLALPRTPNGSQLASMGIYVFSRKFLDHMLAEDAANPQSRHDFGHDVLPKCLTAGKMLAYPFSDAQTQHYWQDVGTLDAYYNVHSDLLTQRDKINLHDPAWPIWGQQQELPPAALKRDRLTGTGSVMDSMLSAGTMVDGADIVESVLSTNVSVGTQSQISGSLLLPGVVVGKNCRLHRAIIDSGSYVPDNTHIGIDIEHDRQRYHVTATGVVVARMP